jgi:hypothetical protein
MAARHSRRWRFCAVAALTLAAVQVRADAGLRSNLDARLLAAHNRERAAAGVPPLEWDQSLAADAAEWGEYLAELGDIEHFPDDPDDPDPQGENLFLGSKGHFPPEAMVGRWIDEKAHFKAGVFPDNSRTGDLEDVGHYTQLMWRTTSRVGCAVRPSEDYEILVCRYSQAGNVIGERPF